MKQTLQEMRMSKEDIRIRKMDENLVRFLVALEVRGKIKNKGDDRKIK